MVRALGLPGPDQQQQLSAAVAACRPRITAALLSATVITLFLTLHITLYDTAVYELQVASGSPPLSVSFNQAITFPTHVHFPRTSRRLPQVSTIINLPAYLFAYSSATTHITESRSPLTASASCPSQVQLLFSSGSQGSVSYTHLDVYKRQDSGGVDT